MLRENMHTDVTVKGLNNNLSVSNDWQIKRTIS